MAASLGLVPTMPNARQGESSRLLKDDDPLETVLLDPPSAAAVEGSDFVPRLKKSVVWMYGVGETGVWASHVIIGFYLNTFLLEVSGLAASKAGNVLLIGQIWDAIINPIIGTLSDTLTTRWGRRRPWIILAALPFTLAYFALWMVWYDASQSMLFGYYVLVYLIFTTASNSMAVPFTALTSDLASTYDHATELTQARMLCNLVVGVTASFTHSIFVELFSYQRSKEAINYRLGYMLSAFIWASIFFIPPLVVFFGIREKPFVSNKEFDENAKGGILAFLKKMGKLWISVFSTLKNRAFMILTIFYFLSWTSVQLVQNNLFLYDKYVIRKESSFTWIMLLLQLVAAASLFGWSFVSRKIGKRLTFIIGLSLWCAVSVGNYWMTDKTPLWAVYVSVTICAIGVSVTFLIPWSMIPDIIDQDEVEYGSRREGVFYSLFVLFQKVGLAIALSSSSYALSGFGYISPAEANPEGDPLYQPSGVIMTLKLINGPIPAIMLALAMVACFFYPLGRKAVADNAEILKKRRADADSISKPAFVPKKDDSSDVSFDIDDAGVGSGTENLRNG